VNFTQVFAKNLAEINERVGNLPQQIKPALGSLDKGRLIRLFWRLAEDHFRLEQKGKLNCKVLIRNGMIEVRDVAPDQIPQLEDQGCIVLDWPQYRTLVKELAKVTPGAQALDLLVEIDETRLRGTPPSIQLQLREMDLEFELRLAELEQEEAKRDKEWQETLRRWEKEKQLRRQRLRCVKD
jgi:hypothetical protein